MTYFILMLGFVCLIVGANLFVDGSASLARIWKVPSLIIGLTIVAMGTSAPEASVSITAGLAGSNEIAVGNVIGSNIFNGMIVVGVCALIASFAVDRKLLKRDIPVALLAAIVLSVMLFDFKLSRLEGMILLLGMAGYIIATIFDALASRKQEQEEQAASGNFWKSLLFIVIGLAMIVLGGDFVVDSASEIAASFGVSENLIALTIVAIGTSLPELVTSITASIKGEHGLALGNAIGSNIFNILFILGLSAVLTPIQITPESIYDAMILIGISVVLLIFAFTRKTFTKKEGFICVAIYLMYTIYIIMR